MWSKFYAAYVLRGLIYCQEISEILSVEKIGETIHFLEIVAVLNLARKISGISCQYLHPRIALDTKT